jgi:predicted SprT family Zn-dependent metalloprotease
MMTPEQMLADALPWADYWWAKFKGIYRLTKPMSTFKMNKRLKTTAGRNFWIERVIDLSVELYGQYPDEFRCEIIPHELAHQVTFDVYGECRQIHGTEWKSVMRAVGREPSTYHSMENQIHAARKAK